jgi:hypothetical protein
LTGSEIAISFLKVDAKPARYRLEGMANYQGGGQDALTTTTFADTVVNIDDSMLPP